MYNQKLKPKGSEREDHDINIHIYIYTISVVEEGGEAAESMQFPGGLSVKSQPSTIMTRLGLEV